MKDVKRVCVVLGGDHGVGAFRLTIHILVRLNSGKVLKDEIGTSTVFCKKDTSEVLKKTILDQLIADLKKINESKLVMTKDGDFIDCELHPEEYQNDSDDSVDIAIDDALFITGDLKWLAMLLGMEDMSSYWCIHCLLGKSGFQDPDHIKGDQGTIDRMKAIRELYGIDDPNNQTTKFGVKAKPFWDFIPITNYCLFLFCIFGWVSSMM